MKKCGVVVTLALAAATLVPIAVAQKFETRNPLPRHFPNKERFVREFAARDSLNNHIDRAAEWPYAEFQRV
jgi:hypothetical protein